MSESGLGQTAAAARVDAAPPLGLEHVSDDPVNHPGGSEPKAGYKCQEANDGSQNHGIFGNSLTLFRAQQTG